MQHDFSIVDPFPSYFCLGSWIIEIEKFNFRQNSRNFTYHDLLLILLLLLLSFSFFLSLSFVLFPLTSFKKRALSISDFFFKKVTATEDLGCYYELL